MGLFKGMPPGVQIKRWLIILIGSIVVLDLIAAASLVTLQRSMTRIQERYQPVLISAGEISTLVYRCQTSLYKYLGEYLPSTDEVTERTAVLERTIEEALNQEAGAEWRADLAAIRASLAKYQVVVKNLPRIGGVTNWEEVNELRTQAVDLGVAMERTATKLKTDATEKIRQQTERSLRISTLAVYLFLAFFALSILIGVLAFVWWNHFQDVILNL
jgi:hypothetical protein